LDGFVMAAGHEGDGIALSAVTGELIAAFLLDRKPAINLDCFSPDRFDLRTTDPMRPTDPETWRPPDQAAPQGRIR
ncbi:MAG: hypothetical protein LC657_11410, partial [Desulfobacteraceae bacterium]|nr:hypothetical protein [Desulfobacteraceae bacterium]